MAEVRKKRDRSSNYTEQEKIMLADIVNCYKHIIEDKRTGGIYLNKKTEAWKAISKKYNSNATTGYRGTEQLKILYDNMKQKARKKVGECNKIEYINRVPLKEVVTKEDLANALQNIKEDKIQINKTGGGVYKPQTTDSDAKVLAIIQDQVDPLPNQFDSGAVYFKDNDDINITPSTYHFDFFASSPPSVHSVQLSIPEEEQSQKKTSETGPDKRKLIERKKPIAKKIVRKLKRNTSAEALKKLYFKKKCQNAALERKKLMQEILYSKQEHVLKMKILNKQLLS